MEQTRPTLGTVPTFSGYTPQLGAPSDISIETTDDGQWRIFTLGPINAGFVLYTSSDLINWSRGSLDRLRQE